jgi:hypothetical protein
LWLEGITRLFISGQKDCIESLLGYIDEFSLKISHLALIAWLEDFLALLVAEST